MSTQELRVVTGARLPQLPEDFEPTLAQAASGAGVGFAPLAKALVVSLGPGAGRLWSTHGVEEFLPAGKLRISFRRTLFPEAENLQPGAALHDAAIGKDGCRRDVARPFAGQKGHDASDFLRRRHASQRDGRIELLHEFGIFHG